MAQFWMKNLVKPALLGGAVLSLGACTYGGAYGDGYVNGAGYACDPYAPFDDYYACDNGYGYANIGFGGGWYDNFYYPGYGIYIFDRGGSRYAMQRHHRQHWAHQRAKFGTRHARQDRRHDWSNRERRSDLTPAQRAERQDRRAERQERRTERHDRRPPNREPATSAHTGRAALRDGAIRGKRKNEARQTQSNKPRNDRRGNSARTERVTPQAAAQQRSRQAHPAVQQKSVREKSVREKSAPAARRAPRTAPKSQPSRRSSRSDISRRNVNID